MDGVPGLSFAGIAPGETFHYRIPVRQSGTYWYHSHSDFQEQLGHAGALIIDPDGPDPIAYDRDYIVMLSDWSDENPDTIYANLLKGSGAPAKTNHPPQLTRNPVASAPKCRQTISPMSAQTSTPT